MRLVHLTATSRVAPLAVALGVAACSVYTEDLLLDEPVEVATDDTANPIGTVPTEPDPADTSGGQEPSETSPDPSEGPTPVAPVPPGAEPAATETSSSGQAEPPSPEPSSGPGATSEPATPSMPTEPGPETPGPEPEPEPSTAEPEPEPDDDAPSDDPSIDDFDSGNQRLNGGQREGFWFSDGSSEGEITPADEAFVNLAGGGKAAHVVATGFDATWAVFGVNFNGSEPAPPYVQAAQYTGVQFWACTSAAGGASELFVEIPTTDTSSQHDSANEDNHYRYALDLTDVWTQYTLAWDDFEQTWGDTKPFAADAVIGIQFSLEDEGFDIWLDNLEFTPADDSTASMPPSGPCPGGASAASDAGAG